MPFFSRFQSKTTQWIIPIKLQVLVWHDMRHNQRPPFNYTLNACTLFLYFCTFLFALSIFTSSFFDPHSVPRGVDVENTLPMNNRFSGWRHHRILSTSLARHTTAQAHTHTHKTTNKSQDVYLALVDSAQPCLHVHTNPIYDMCAGHGNITLHWYYIYSPHSTAILNYLLEHTNK